MSTTHTPESWMKKNAVWLMALAVALLVGYSLGRELTLFQINRAVDRAFSSFQHEVTSLVAPFSPAVLDAAEPVELTEIHVGDSYELTDSLTLTVIAHRDIGGRYTEGIMYYEADEGMKFVAVEATIKNNGKQQLTAFVGDELVLVTADGREYPLFNCFGEKVLTGAEIPAGIGRNGYLLFQTPVADTKFALCARGK